MPSALHTIMAYPPDLSDPVFALYPAMKFGDRRSIDHYADRLAPLALRLIAESRLPNRDWVLTSPVLRGLPCGANLLCRALHARLARAVPEGISVSLATLRRNAPRSPIESEIDFAHYNEYSKQDQKTRREILSAPDSDVTCDWDKFRNGCVIFVNDISVTGTQMRWFDDLLRASPPRILHWLLIANVEGGIGCRFPHLESEINNSAIQGCEEFISFLQTRDFAPTGKLVARLLSYDVESLTRIFRALDRGKRNALHQAILDEGLYGGEFFREKMAVVERESAFP